MTASRACLLIHGFTGGPYEIQPLADELKQWGWECCVPLLPGHEQLPDSLRHVVWQDWAAAIDDEAGRLVEAYGAFDLVGFSMGGLLAAYAARRHPVRRLVLLNTALIYFSPGRMLREWNNRMWDGVWDLPGKWRTTPVQAAWQFTRLVRHMKGEFEAIQAPTLIIQGQRDQVAHPFGAQLIKRRLHCEHKLMTFPRSRHLICHDVEADLVHHAVRQFLQ
ncbi:alpha/beta hydrolase [Paenibacillus sp. y28]|uniref:alpha/beta hydrolase n=1 Tax=Paenibacillus sp. y28 TaxID=3129110 RepID=UPI00301B0C5B